VDGGLTDGGGVRMQPSGRSRRENCYEAPRLIAHYLVCHRGLGSRFVTYGFVLVGVSLTRY
jgi:hypothetical protein